MKNEAYPSAVTDFITYLEVIQNKSRKTVEEYTIDLRTFFRFMKMYKKLTDKDILTEIEINDIDYDFVKSINTLDIYAFLSYASRDMENAASTRARKTSTLRSYFKYLTVKTKRLEVNPMADIETPKKKKTLPKHLSLEESIDLLNTVSTDAKDRERNYAIMTLFLNCGLRVSEVVGINLSDINFNDNTMRVTGKGNKQRQLYINEACVTALNDYIKIRMSKSPKEKDKNALFVSRLNSRISVKTVQWLVYKYLNGSGLANKGYSAHKLRHTAATLMYQHGNADLLAIKSILGHEDLSTTQIYTHLGDKQVKAAAESNPLASVKRKATSSAHNSIYKSTHESTHESTSADKNEK